jgi:glucose-1-phosphate thymidylyltransferase
VYAIVLAGGYAKRLWPLTLGVPKALLPVAGKPILDYIVEKLRALNPPLTHIVLSTNMLFQPQFQAWLDTKSYSSIKLVPDASSNEKQKPGAIKAIANIIKKEPKDDVLVIAGDGMFTDNLLGFLEAFNKKNGSVVALYEVANLEEAKRCATVTVDGDGTILDFAEKPAKPTTTLVCGAVYAFKRGINRRFSKYLALKLPTDQPGRFIEWLCRQETVYGYMLKDYLWDIGTHQAYQACNVCFSNSGAIPLIEKLSEVNPV